ncbi:hypothetical protein GCM10010171_42270 [Actinokineospora fastidiosa]|uniref:Uncharacterized protein n=2 Tax=Actinokineospora fastidiosa TaxID=1816 RepID=A0A918LFH5_9PSEU|nr:hypothetical protein GCM10010171_42270 [Actinokineospora fastidiosa]
MLNLTRPAMAALALVLASPAGVSACGLGCSAELSLPPAHVEGHGQPLVDLTLTATLTNNDKPVSGVDVEFLALGPDGILLGSATTGPDGTARLTADNALGPDSIRGHKATSWTTYAARVAVIQSSEQAADTICAEQATAPFEFVP